MKPVKLLSRGLTKTSSWLMGRRVRSLRAKRGSEGYLEAPLVSAIVQVFNKRKTIGRLIRRLQELPVDEIIVIDDGSGDGTWREAMSMLNRKNDFLIRSNDLYEVRTYERALSMARGRYGLLLQDDDLPPADPGWINTAVRLFEMDPKLLILGGRQGLTILPPDPVSVTPGSSQAMMGRLGGTPGVNQYEIIDFPAFCQDRTPFQYVMAINRAPMWVRRLPFLQEIGIDQQFAPFQCDDVDECIRAWLAGWRVGFYPARFERLGESGMKVFNEEQIPEQARKNWKIIYERYLTVILGGELADLIAAANRELEET